MNFFSIETYESLAGVLYLKRMNHRKNFNLPMSLN